MPYSGFLGSERKFKHEAIRLSVENGKYWIGDFMEVYFMIRFSIGLMGVQINFNGINHSLFNLY